MVAICAKERLNAMENIKDKYQLSKTIRFGLTSIKKKAKVVNSNSIFQSHSILKELTDISEDRIQKKVSVVQKSEMQFSVDNTRDTLLLIKNFMSGWKGVYARHDQIVLDKDFYKKLSKKIGFESFWIEDGKNGKTKKPQSREIGLTELSKKDGFDKERKQYILDYWKNNLQKYLEKSKEVDEKLSQFEQALKGNRTDNRPNEVELRKMLLSLFNVVHEVLEPICLGQISFPKLEKLTESSENKTLRGFASDIQSKSNLARKILELRKYFEENGGNVPYCRATLNPNTAIKNPNSTDGSIYEEIRELGLDKLLKDHNNVAYLENSLNSLSAGEKLRALKDEKCPIVKRALLFKYKPIPAIVQYEIARVLSKELNKDESELREFLRSIGQIKSPAKDYADMVDKTKFNIIHYPLKVAFDFAWEALAKAKFHADIELPTHQCVDFLKTNFSVDVNDANLKFYAQLLELRSLLATLEYGKPNNINEIEDSIKTVLSEIDWRKFTAKNSHEFKPAIVNWLKNKRTNDRNFAMAKQQIGLIRGRQKLAITRYKEITETYKSIAMVMGKKYAEMRDKITGAAELNKISHYAMVIEDANEDRYVLLQEYVDINNRVFDHADFDEDEFKAITIDSITSAAISKMIKKQKIDELRANENNKGQTKELTAAEKEIENIKTWKSFISRKDYDRKYKLDLDNKDFEQIKKEIDSKCFKLVTQYVSGEMLTDFVKNKNCLLLPIVNQDLAKKIKTDQNQFTKDWNAIFTQNTPWRLTPEFRVSYRKPTPNYPKSDLSEKRYSRFQMIGHFLCDYIPQSSEYISNREMIANFKDDKKQNEVVQEFHNQLKGKADPLNSNAMAELMTKWGSHQQNSKNVKDAPKEKYFVFGIDRGQKELATLCVIDQDKKIFGDFDIYTRSFNTEKKQWEHTFLDKRHILDLSNLRVETTLVINNQEMKKKVLVDLSMVKVKDKNGCYTKTNKMQVKMQQLAYIRKLQFQMQTNAISVLEWYKTNNTSEAIVANFVDKPTGEKGLVTFYGAAVEELKDTLPLERIKNMLKEFKELKLRENQGEKVKAELDKLVQLEPVDNLKAGVVANMIGVVAYLLEKFDYQVYISLEDLTNHPDANDGVTGAVTKAQSGEGKRLDVEKYAGLGLYNFFEMQLLKKLFRIQLDSHQVLHLVPAFRATKNYEKMIAGNGKIKNQFGVVFFVDADATSKMCPRCESTKNEPKLEKYPKAQKGNDKDGKSVWVDRDKTDGHDHIRCFVCGFDTSKEYSENPLKYIKSGDDNAAYLISASAVKAYELAKVVTADKNKI